jgi:lipid A disaccharide synthetase
VLDEAGNGGMKMDKTSFSDIAMVSCGTLTLELNH